MKYYEHFDKLVRHFLEHVQDLDTIPTFRDAFYDWFGVEYESDNELHYAFWDAVTSNSDIEWK